MRRSADNEAVPIPIQTLGGRFFAGTTVRFCTGTTERSHHSSSFRTHPQRGCEPESSVGQCHWVLAPYSSARGQVFRGDDAEVCTGMTERSHDSSSFRTHPQRGCEPESSVVQTSLGPRVRGEDDEGDASLNPASVKRHWVPAFAGTTMTADASRAGLRRDDGERRSSTRGSLAGEDDDGALAGTTFALY
jgi:hypothetical protein